MHSMRPHVLAMGLASETELDELAARPPAPISPTLSAATSQLLAASWCLR